MFRKLLIYILVAVLGLFLAIWFVPGVKFNGHIEITFLSGIFLGLVNYFVKPVLKLISFPIRIFTLGIFTLFLNVFLVWVVIDILSPIEIEGILPLLATTSIIWFLTIILNSFLSDKK